MRFKKDEFIQVDKQKVKDEKTNLALYLSTRIIAYILLIFFAIFFIWYTVFVTTHTFCVVYGVSMMNTLNNKIPSENINQASMISYDAVYIENTKKVNLFDIVVIKKPDKTDQIIKRVMAKEGDFVTIAKAVVDGESHYYFYRIAAGTDLTDFDDESARMDELGANGYSIRSYADWDDNKQSTENLFAEGESGGGSHVYESVFFGTFLQEYFSGKTDGYFVSPTGLVFVQVPAKHIFYMGDNRGHSDDARKDGFCSVEYIVGRTEFIVYDYNFVNRLWQVVKFYFSEVEDFFAR